MRKIVLTWIVCMVALVGRAQAIGTLITINDVNYQISDDVNREVMVVGGSFGSNYVLSIPDAITTKYGQYKVVKVAGGIFKGNDNIVQVVYGLNLREIGDEAFADCQGLKKVILNSSPNLKWGTGVFSSCMSLESVSVDGDISEAKQLFYNCWALTTAELGENVTVLPEQCFDSCQLLNSVTMKGGVTAILANAFNYTPALTSIEWPQSLTTLGDYAFHSSGLADDITVPAGMQLGIGVFATTHIPSITFEDGITDVPDHFCESASKLTSITIPESVNKIGYRAFRYCSALEEVEIPMGVNEIDGEAFNGCNALKVVKALPLVPPAMTVTTGDMSPYVFSSTTYQNATLMVNASAYEQYKAAFVWQNFRYVEKITPTAIDRVEEQDAAPAVRYYDLNGRQLSNPQRGIVIKESGNKTQKVML